MKLLRPEVYANTQLKQSLKIKDIDPDSIHDARVSLRKYYDVLSSLYPVYENSECLFLAKEVISILGKVRDMDICNRKENRDILAKKAIKKIQRISLCYLPPKIFGSRLLIFNRILRIYSKIDGINDFHELRKMVRTTRNLIESLGYENKDIKNLAKKMGDIRDEILKMECNGWIPPSINLEIYKEEAISIIMKFLKTQNEFHYYTFE
ncbi:hypothetical protein SJAV_25160 [Sulfurisphaera javensis]|uniref:CHAD domain-containing protein n=1 Tax=Sulfurisphaera javensis TaxID=2049879 RepID=A0AAT9GUD7_9CREN